MTTQTLLLHLNGEDVTAEDGGTFAVRNPYDHTTLYEVAHATPADVDFAVRAAREAFADGRWAGLPVRERARVLSRAARELAENIDDLARLETLQIGRPVREMRSQLARLPEWFEHFGALVQVEEGSAPDFGPDRMNIVRRRPLGVAALVTPWNHPLLITVKKLSVALAAGNSVVVKPSEAAPAGPLRLVALLEAAGVPAGVINVVPGLGPTTGKALVEHAGIDRLDITGGTPTGRNAAAVAGRNLVPVSAELGGKAPVIVLDDVDPERAVAGALFASFIATGQTCVQGARLLVHRDVLPVVEKRLVKRVQALRLGDPLDAATQIGPLVSEQQRARVAEAVDRAVAQGARLACGGRIPAEPAHGWFYEPTVLCDVTPAMDVWYEEIFGPVTVVRSFADDTEAVDQANDSPFGLAASIWTRDTARALRMADRLDIGIVWINDHHRVDPASPWGGTKDSGIGTENSRDAYLSYTRPHSVVVNISADDFDWFATSAELRYS